MRNLKALNERIIEIMRKIRKEWDSEFKQWVMFDEDDVVDGTPGLGIKMIKSGALGREAQYRYFSEHPDEK